MQASQKIVITHDPTHVNASTVAPFAIDEVKEFDAFPVLSFLCKNDDIDSIKNLKGVRYVHIPADEIFSADFYIKILQHFNNLCKTSKERLAQGALVNLSIGPRPAPFNELEPINVATRAAADKGISVVIASGNAGPADNTLNPWSVAPWVIGVGAANRSGNKLWKGSSVGIPDHHLYHPTVVAPGEDILVLAAGSGGRKKHHGTSIASILIGLEPAENGTIESGTSYAAPVVVLVCHYLIKFIETLKEVDQIHKMIWGKEFDFLKFQAIEGTLRKFEPFPFLLSKLKENNMNYGLNISPYVLKQMLKRMAKPMEGYAAYQIGAGFVDEKVAKQYLIDFSIQDFFQAFGGKLDDNSLSILGDTNASLIPEEIVHTIFTSAPKEARFIDYSIYE